LTPSTPIAAGVEISRAFAAIFSAGLLCGVMDITAAFITWWPKGVKPSRLLQGIAAGWLGPDSFKGGMPTAALGLAFHFLIAFTAAFVFYAASRQLAFMIHRPIVSGVLYGIAVYLVMYWIVMPLSNFHGTKTVTSSIVAIVTHIICVGLPISLVIRRFSR
jgi:asparagine N-glycosylation enzyme membrane subunit Stt3